MQALLVKAQRIKNKIQLFWFEVRDIKIFFKSVISSPVKGLPKNVFIWIFRLSLLRGSSHCSGRDGGCQCLRMPRRIPVRQGRELVRQ